LFSILSLINPICTEEAAQLQLNFNCIVLKCVKSSTGIEISIEGMHWNTAYFKTLKFKALKSENFITSLLFKVPRLSQETFLLRSHWGV